MIILTKFVQVLRKWIYRLSFPFIILFSLAGSYFFLRTLGLEFLSRNAIVIASSGIGIAAFLFTVQGILVAIPENNRFMKTLRSRSQYLLYLFSFCRRAEITFMIVFVPVLFLEKNESDIYAFVVLSAYSFAFLFSTWAMWLMGAILIRCEKLK